MVHEFQRLKNHIETNLSFYTDKSCNDIFIEGKKYSIEELSIPISSSAFINLEENELSVHLNKEKWKQNYEIGKIFYKKLNAYNEYIGDISHKNFWAYITHCSIIKNYIIDRYFNKTNINTEEEDSAQLTIVQKVERYFFGERQITRTGIIFNWALTNCLYYKDIGNVSDDLCLTAFSYIDSVKAIYERNFKKNPLIVKAFVQGIIKNNRSIAFKDQKFKYRSKIPTHISNIAAINFFDAYTYAELVQKITDEQKILIEEYEYEKSYNELISKKTA